MLFLGARVPFLQEGLCGAGLGGECWPWMLQAQRSAHSSASPAWLPGLLFASKRKLNREMQIPLNNLTKLMEPGLGPVGAQGDQAGLAEFGVWGKGWGDLGSWTRSHCPGAAAAPQCSPVLVPCWQKRHISLRGGALSPPSAAQARARSRWSPS